MGAWIETLSMSYPFFFVLVAPYVGAWIETTPIVSMEDVLTVAPYVGAWIETCMNPYKDKMERSHPTWVRGLKHFNANSIYHIVNVAPYVGAWIETTLT